jgi:hypothetical protein
MPDSITKAITRPGVVPAFFAGLGVFLLLLAIGFLHSLFSTLTAITQFGSGGDQVAQIWGGQLLESLTGPLPFAVGVFLCFWQLAPIAPMLRLAHVVTRSILAALLGALAMWLVLVVAQVIADIATSPFSFHAANVFGSLGADVLGSLFSAFGATAQYLPSVALAAILLWGWQQRHPNARPVHGALDEV